MSYKAHTFVVAALCVSATSLQATPASAVVLSYEQTANGRNGAQRGLNLLWVLSR